MLDNLLGYIRTYRELAFLFTSIVGVFVSVVGGVFFVRDYFATKADVATLKCQAESSIAIIDSRINTDHLTQQLISLKKEIADGLNKLKAAKLDGTNNEYLISLDLELENLRKWLDREDAIRVAAAERLKPGVCEASARQK